MSPFTSGGKITNCFAGTGMQTFCFSQSARKTTHRYRHYRPLKDRNKCTGGFQLLITEFSLYTESNIKVIYCCERIDEFQLSKATQKRKLRDVFWFVWFKLISRTIRQRKDSCWKSGSPITTKPPANQYLIL